MEDAVLINFLVREINDRVDLFGDLVSEEHEESLITPVVELTVPYIPAFIRPVLIDAADGLDDDERRIHQAKLVNYLHERIDSDIDGIPWYGRALIISTLKAVTAKIAEFVFEYAQRGITLIVEDDNESTT